MSKLTKRHIYRGGTNQLWCGKHYILRGGAPMSISESQYDAKVYPLDEICVSCRRSLAVARSKGKP